LRRADPPSKESYRLCKKDYETEEEPRAQQRAVVSLMNERMNFVLLFVHCTKCVQVTSNADSVTVRLFVCFISQRIQGSTLKDLLLKQVKGKVIPVQAVEALWVTRG
jgi:hypothetical protein